MKAKRAIFFLVLLTALCGCTTQTSNNTDDMLETKTYLYSYEYETEPDGELSTAYHEEKPSVNQNESRDVVKATVNFKKNAVTYIKMNEPYSFGNCECSITEAYKTCDSGKFYSFINENYYNFVSQVILKDPTISNENGAPIHTGNCFFCIKVKLKYMGQNALNMSVYSTIFADKPDKMKYDSATLMFIDRAFDNNTNDTIYLEPNQEYDLWFFYYVTGKYSNEDTYYVKGNFQNYNDNDSYNGYLIELNELTEID